MTTDPQAGNEVIQRYEAKQRQLRKARRRRRLAAGLAALVVTALAGLIVGLVPRAAEVHEVSGTVRCTSGAVVTGIYLREGRGSQEGFAGKHPVGDSPSIVRYRHTILTRTYAINVGCGGTEAAWKIEVYSDFVSGHENDFVCHDIVNAPRYRECELE